MFPMLILPASPSSQQNLKNSFFFFFLIRRLAYTVFLGLMATWKISQSEKSICNVCVETDAGRHRDAFSNIEVSVVLTVEPN